MYTEQGSQVTIYPPKLKTKSSISQDFSLNKSTTKLGKIYRGPIYTAYNRKTIGSIPSTIENILFQTNKGEILRCSYNINENDIKLNDNEILNNKIHIRKNNDIAPRFNYSNIEKEKYYPGPGQYNTNNISSFINNNEVNYRYNGLFNYGRNEIPINVNENNSNIGPGKYNNDLLKSERKIYISPFNRFQKTKHDYYQKVLGPGTYDINLNISDKYKNDNKSKIFQTEINNTRDRKIIKEKEILPGPGSYEISKSFIKKNNNRNNNIKIYKYISDIKSSIKDSIKYDENEYDEIEYNRLKKELYEMDEKNRIQKLKGFTMEKNIPRFIFPGNNKEHVPGPCYYNPKLQSKRYEFNSNDDNKWM